MQKKNQNFYTKKQARIKICDTVEQFDEIKASTITQIGKNNLANNSRFL